MAGCELLSGPQFANGDWCVECYADRFSGAAGSQRPDHVLISEREAGYQRQVPGRADGNAEWHRTPAAGQWWNDRSQGAPFAGDFAGHGRYA